MGNASIDENRTKTALGVSSAGFVTPITAAVNPSTHAWLVEISGGSVDQDVNIVAIGGNPVTTTLPVSGTVTANQGTSPWVVNTASAVSATAPANAFQVAGVNSSGNLIALHMADYGDTIATNIGLITVPYILGTNGVNYDRTRVIVNGNNTSGIGIQAAGILAQFDDASIGSVTENNFGNLRMNANRQLYAQNVQIDTLAASTSFTITLASLANSTAGVGRQSTLITGNTARSAIISFKFTTGTTPTANSLVYLYLIRSDGTLTDDSAGASDAGLTVVNAPLLGTLLIPTNASNTTYIQNYDTKFLGSLGTTFGVAVVNSSGVTANSTGGNFDVRYTLLT